MWHAIYALVFLLPCRFVFVGLASGSVAVLTTHFWLQ